MEKIVEIEACRKICAAAIREGRRIAFVPTMGALHPAHRALLDLGRELGDVLVLSIFVNPKQFGPKEDLARYPRREAEDLALAEGAGVDLVFCPTVEQMYPPGSQTFVTVEDISRPLCGRVREGHFRGVATVVTSLFHIVRPHVAVFGEKDYQQLAIVRRLVRDLHFNIEIASLPTMRAGDGLALSSRNAYLNANERMRATTLYAGLKKAESLLGRGQRSRDELIQAAALVMGPAVTEIDYVDLVHPETLEPLAMIGEGETGLLAVAAFVGKTRLIDNLLLRG